MKDAKDKYVQDQLREMLYTMKQDKIPKGVTFSTVLMSAPLFAMTAYCAGMAPMAMNPQFVDPGTFAYMVRSSMRLLSLNIGFMGGIHYGFAAAVYETCNTEEEKKRCQYQMAYSFVPAMLVFGASSLLLFATPLTT